MILEILIKKPLNLLRETREKSYLVRRRYYSGNTRIRFNTYPYSTNSTSSEIILSIISRSLLKTL